MKRATVTSLIVVMLGVIGVLIAARNSAPEEEILKIGEQAPAVSLMDQTGELQTLEDYRGEWLVLYFYPRNDTPGCTTEACTFRDDYLHLRERGARVLGVSLDSADSHAAFAEKYALPFPLLSDRDGTASKAYGTLWGIWPVRFSKRHTFIIDPDGRIAQIYRDVKPKTHSQRVLDDLDRLQARSGPSG